jgi:hypothetical protein
LSRLLGREARGIPHRTRDYLRHLVPGDSCVEISRHARDQFLAINIHDHVIATGLHAGERGRKQIGHHGPGEVLVIDRTWLEGQPKANNRIQLTVRARVVLALQQRRTALCGPGLVTVPAKLL